MPLLTFEQVLSMGEAIQAKASKDAAVVVDPQHGIFATTVRCYPLK